MGEAESSVDVLLIGGGVAGASVATELRSRGFAGSITLTTREFDAPYHRPPITKELLGTAAADYSIAVHPRTWWQDNDVTLLTRSAVATLDPDGGVATLVNKQRIRFGQAVLATGAVVRRLNIDGTALKGIHYLRVPANAAQLKAEADTARRAVLVGGSFIAVEVAASLAARGIECTLVMQEDGPLVRAFGPQVSAYVRDLLHAHGVHIVCNADVTAFVGEERVQAVRTSRGDSLTAELVVVGCGALPDTKLARSAGLTIGPAGGVLCDTRLRSSSPSIFAAGDMCEYDSVVHGCTVRVEHEEHAIAQGVTVAHNLIGADEPHTEVPYFWTSLADWAELEYVGAAQSWDEETVTGSLASGDFTVWYRSRGKLVAALTSGRPADLVTAREQLTPRASAVSA